MDVALLDEPIYRRRRRWILAGYLAIPLLAILFGKTWKMWIWSRETTTLALCLYAGANVALLRVMFSGYRCLHCGRHFRHFLKCLTAVDPFAFPDRCPACQKPVLVASTLTQTRGVPTYALALLVLIPVAAIFWIWHAVVVARAMHPAVIPHVVESGTWSTPEHR